MAAVGESGGKPVDGDRVVEAVDRILLGEAESGEPGDRFVPWQ